MRSAGVLAQEQPDSRSDHRQAEPLSHAQAEREQPEKRVGFARELAHETGGAVADEEERRHLPARPRARREPPQQGEQREALERHLVEL